MPTATQSGLFTTALAAILQHRADPEDLVPLVAPFAQPGILGSAALLLAMDRGEVVPKVATLREQLGRDQALLKLCENALALLAEDFDQVDTVGKEICYLENLRLNRLTNPLIVCLQVAVNHEPHFKAASSVWFADAYEVLRKNPSMEVVGLLHLLCSGSDLPTLALLKRAVDRDKRVLSRVREALGYLLQVAHKSPPPPRKRRRGSETPTSLATHPENGDGRILTTLGRSLTRRLKTPPDLL